MVAKSGPSVLSTVKSVALVVSEGVVKTLGPASKIYATAGLVREDVLGYRGRNSPNFCPSLRT